MSDLMDRATLTEEAIEGVIARLDVDEWGERFIIPQHVTPIDRAVAAEACEKALRAVVDWLLDLNTPSGSTDAAIELRRAMEAAGIPRPEDRERLLSNTNPP